MPMYLPTSFRRIASLRTFSVLSTVVLLGLVVPSASARRSTQRKHPRIRAMAHAFVNAALPGIGLLPEATDDLPSDGQKYELKLTRSHSGEMVDVVYRIGDTYIPEALDKLNDFLRDSHNEEVSHYDPRTFDVLHTVLEKLGKTSNVVDILSGYRSQETNDELRESRTTNAAKHSEHIEAKAIDIRVPGVPANLLRDAALSVGAGGVGYYPSRQFVHVDVGPVRQWTFSPRAASKHSRRRRHS